MTEVSAPTRDDALAALAAHPAHEAALPILRAYAESDDPTSWRHVAFRVTRPLPGEAPPLPAADAPRPPSMARMALDFAAATARWVAAGRPVVDDAEHGRRLAICRAPCVPYYDPTRSACLKCGCGTRPVAVALGFDLAEKARWATEGCPIGMW